MKGTSGFIRGLQWGLIITVGAAVLSACGSTPRRDLQRYVPAVALNPQEPVAAATTPTNLATLAPTDKQVVVSTPDVDTRALKAQVLKDERSVFFDYDGATVKPEYNDLIKAVAAEVAKSNIRALRVEGNTDGRGSREYNLALGQRRANGVKSALTTFGVSAGIITTISYGKEKLLAPGDDEESNAINRRADILYQGEY